MTALLEVEDLHVRYGRIAALSGVSMQVHEGQVTAVVGPNGAGKTSLVTAIMGLTPSSGRISFVKWPGCERSVEARVSARVALVPETRELFGPMSVEDNLRLGAYALRGEPSSEKKSRLHQVYGIFPRLAERRTQLAHTLSGGERQMLALGRALMAAPKLLMLDEPSLGLAPLIVAEVFRTIERLKSEGISILLIEQNARAALKVADAAYVIEGGLVQMHGRASDLARDPKVVESYLGVSGGWKHASRFGNEAG
jgi:branched-chain amino acid transport system ATP-binding protein